MFILMKVSILLLLFTLPGCNRDNIITYRERTARADSLVIREGILSQHATIINYERDGSVVAKIELSEPVMVAKATRKEEWGYFQFPSIGRASDGTLVVTWQMADDSHTAYGKASNRASVPMMSKDGGKTWGPQDEDYFVLSGNYHVNMRNGNSLQVYTPTSKIINEFDYFPEPVGKDLEYTYYLLDSLPKSLRNIYFNIFDKTGKSTFLESELHDKGALRFAIDGSMPVLWWGNIKQLADNSLVAGIYPNFYIDDNSQVTEAVSFYSSDDEGKSWYRVGLIPFVSDEITKKYNVHSFDEPAFEVLEDSTFICIMRTSSESPMYRSFSRDYGNSWSKPAPFTPNGVRPWLMKLKNGVLVLTSGRPGVQIRFSLDGKGYHWTTPIEMIPFMHNDGTYALSNTCGYAAILEDGENSFFIVYSDFTTRNFLGQHRKSIWVRHISVNRY